MGVSKMFPQMEQLERPSRKQDKGDTALRQRPANKSFSMAPRTRGGGANKESG